MKNFLKTVLICSSAVTSWAQWAVHDPINTAVNTGIQTAQSANHAETLQKWAVQLEKLNRQIRQLEAQLIEQRRIREVIGDPSLAGVQMILEKLGSEDLARSYGETWRAIRRLNDASQSLQRTAGGIYREIEDVTVLNQRFERQTSTYLPFAVVDAHVENLDQITHQTTDRRVELQSALSDSLAELRNVSTQAEVDQLHIKVAVLNGQLAVIESERQRGLDQLLAQSMENQNQAEKHRQDLLEKQINDESQTRHVINAWQQSIRIAPDVYTRP
jgi:DNA-directed RNA polymerase subunit L